jgi:hypothetical protein
MRVPRFSMLQASRLNATRAPNADEMESTADKQRLFNWKKVR